MAAGSSNVVQTAVASINQGDFESLAKFLREHGIEQPDIDALHDAIRRDEKRGHGDEMGPEKAGWLARMYNKARAGIWQVSTSVATNVLTEALNKYLGL